MKKIAVFASGGGTDFQSVIDANESEKFCIIEYLVASKPEIGAIERAKKHRIKPLVFDKTSETKEEFYARVATTLKNAGVEYIVLAGWLLVVPPSFIKAFENAIINIDIACFHTDSTTEIITLTVDKCQVIESNN